MSNQHIQEDGADSNIRNQAAVRVIKVNRCLREVRIKQRFTYGIELRITLTKCGNIKDNDRRYFLSAFSMPGAGLF